MSSGRVCSTRSVEFSCGYEESPQAAIESFHACIIQWTAKHLYQGSCHLCSLKKFTLLTVGDGLHRKCSEVMEQGLILGLSFESLHRT